MRLLIAEDDAMLGAGLKRALERAGYAADWVKSGEDALAAVAAEAYGLILMDLGLPETSGLEAVRQIRRSGQTVPIIVVTAQDRPEQKVGGLDAGADDYVVKPFDLDELLARIRAQVRSHDRRTTNLLTAQDVVLDLGARTVAKGGVPVNVTAKEFKVLAVLLRRAGQFVSKTDLEAALYDADAEVESNTIETAIYALRRKLGSELIVTARGLGYTISRRG